MEFDKSPAENVLRKVLKRLDISHVDATLVFSATLAGMLRYMLEKDALEDLTRIFPEDEVFQEYFNLCLGDTLFIIRECQKIELADREES